MSSPILWQTVPFLCVPKLSPASVEAIFSELLKNYYFDENPHSELNISM
jgi:hypothetical protein